MADEPVRESASGFKGPLLPEADRDTVMAVRGALAKEMQAMWQMQVGDLEPAMIYDPLGL